MLTRRQKIILTLALGHFVLVVIGAASLRPWNRLGAVGKPLYLYSEASGASAGYGFFAPGVGSQLRARFEVINADGTRREVPLETRRSHEADLRVGNIVGQFWSEVADRKLQRSLAASWAGKIFGRYPGTETVQVRIESFEPVSMEEYRQGKRPAWTPVYDAKFAIKGKKGESRVNPS